MSVLHVCVCVSLPVFDYIILQKTHNMRKNKVLRTQLSSYRAGWHISEEISSFYGKTKMNSKHDESNIQLVKFWQQWFSSPVDRYESHAGFL